MEDQLLQISTKLCTRLFTIDKPITLDEIDFEERTFDLDITCFPAGIKNSASFNTVEMLGYYSELIRCQEEDRKPKKRSTKFKESFTKFKPKMLQSKFNLEFAYNLGVSTLKDLKTKGRCSGVKARKAIFEMRIRGNIAALEHHKSHKQAEIQKLDNSLKDPSNAYFSTALHKRSNPSFSRSFIANRLKLLGYSYKTLLRVKKQKSKRVVPKEDFIKLLGNFQTSMEKRVKLLFVDQFKMVFKQTPTKAWQSKAQGLIYDDREDSLIVTACVACTMTGYLGCQFFIQEMNSIDFMYFTKSLLARCFRSEPIMICVDRAPWHTSSQVQSSEIKDYLLYNIPGFPMSNLIENSFSALRLEFRSRPILDSLAKECLFFYSILSKEK